MTATEEQLFEQIGRLSTAFAALEGQVARLLCLLLGASSAVSVLLIKDLSYARLIELFSRYAKLTFADEPDVVKRYTDLAGRLNNMRKLRNTLIHGDWIMQPPNCAVWQFKPAHDAEHGLFHLMDETKSVTFTLPRMQQLLEDVRTLGDDVGALMAGLIRENIAEMDHERKGSDSGKPRE